ncbi:MAG: UDP-N-acetylmuramate dehydrogenase [Candidatus Bruticola sp.]
MYNFIKTNVAISSLTTFEIGGPAAYLAEPTTLSELKESITFARQHKLPIFPIGSGSNILAADSGFPGLLIKSRMQDLKITTQEDYVCIEAQSGVLWDDLVAQSVSLNSAGLECLSGIPGQVGAAPVQNIGAYGQEAANCIEHVQVLDLDSLELKNIPTRDCAFAYRTSNFKTIWKDRFFITSVSFKLKHQGQASLRYQDLERFFAEQLAANKNWRPNLNDVRQAVLQVRASKSMLYDKKNPNHRCAGSFYLNPIVEYTKAQQLKEQYPSIPVYATDNQNLCKISAAWLVDQAGFCKGFRHGRAGVSSAHTLALINAGGASADDILAFSAEITAKIHEKFGIQLVPEPVMLGFR